MQHYPGRKCVIRVAVVALFLWAAGLPLYGATQTVAVSNPSTSGDLLAFSPSTVTIFQGDTVKWCWAGDCNGGTATLESHSTSSGNCCTKGTQNGDSWDSDPSGVSPATSGTFSHTFSVLGNGVFNYFCEVHLSLMTGQVIVIGPATHFQASTGTTTLVAGGTFSVSLTALDANGRVRTNYSSSSLVANDTAGGASITPGYSWSGGSTTITVTLTKAGSQTVTIHDNATGINANGLFLTVSPGPLDHFAITAPPTATAGANTNIGVAAEDSFNNIKTDYASTVQITSSDAAATVGGSLVPTTSSLPGGSQSFSVVFNTISPPDRTFMVADQGGTGISNSVNITVNSANCPGSDKTFTNSTAISVPDVSPASPFPSTIPVSMPGQVVGKVTVTLHGIHHTFYSDVDIMLQAPGGQRLVLQSFAAIGENAGVQPIELTFDDAATQVLPQNISSTGNELPGGSYRPTAYSTGSRPAFSGLVAPFPLPATAGSSTLESAFAGMDPNGTWSLYIQDNVGGDSGAVDGGWSITITPAYASPTSASISFSTTGNSGGTATTTPYPSTIPVSGVPGNIAGLSLIINGLTVNSCSADMAYLLQGPGGHFIIPMSLIGRCFSATNANITVSDTAATPLPPFNNALTSGLYRLSSYEQTQGGFGFPLSFSSPAPAGPYGVSNLAANDGTATFSSVFSGSDPNGTWSLYPLYQPQIPGAPADTGSISSWSLRFELQCPTCSTSVAASTGTSSTFNQSVMFTAAVSSNFEQPGGNVTFCDGSASAGTCTGTTLGTGPLDGTGHATFTTSALAAGAHSITANFAGDNTYPPATSAVLTFTVSKGLTQTFLSSSPNPSTFGQSVTFTANVAPGPFGGSPTGTVTFKDGATTLGSTALSAGTATFTTSALTASASPHSITAVYGGNSSFLTSTSTALTQTVNKANSATALASSLNPSTYGTNVTFTATVTSGAGTPTGTVTFKDGAATLGSPALSAGKATFSSSTLSVGSHSITATYNGAGDYNTSVSSTLTQTVNKQSTTTSALTSKPAGAFYGQSITFTASVTPTVAGPSAPSGSVTFKDNGVALAPAVTLSSGTASLACAPGNPCPALNVGTHPITALYNGDGNYTTSTSSALTQTVNKTATALKRC